MIQMAGKTFGWCRERTVRLNLKDIRTSSPTVVRPPQPNGRRRPSDEDWHRLLPTDASHRPTTIATGPCSHRKESMSPAGPAEEVSCLML